MDFWRKKKEKEAVVEDAEAIEAAAQEPGKSASRSTALALRPIPEDALILVPLRNAVLFPHVISPEIGRAHV